jgi:hypothetical protein
MYTCIKGKKYKDIGASAKCTIFKNEFSKEYPNWITEILSILKNTLN